MKKYKIYGITNILFGEETLIFEGKSKKEIKQWMWEKFTINPNPRIIITRIVPK